MKGRASFITHTVKAGVFFVIPVIIVLFIILKIIGLLAPIANYIDSVADPRGIIPFFSTAISILILILIFFLAGILEKFFSGSAKLIVWIENNILSVLPAYQLIKSTTQQSIGMDSAMNLKVVLVPTDGWVLAFLVDELANEEVLVFVPGSPKPYEGTLNLFRKSEIRNTNLTPKDAYDILTKTGIGTRSVFEKATIDPPREQG